MAKSKAKKGVKGVKWTAREKKQFDRGIVLHGWGSWRSMEYIIPTRTRVQIKSHAQKVAKIHPGLTSRLIEEHAAKSLAMKKATAVAMVYKSPKKRIIALAKKQSTTTRRANGGINKGAASDSSHAKTAAVTKQSDTSRVVNKPPNNTASETFSIKTRRSNRLKKEAKNFINEAMACQSKAKSVGVDDCILETQDISATGIPDLLPIDTLSDTIGAQVVTPLAVGSVEKPINEIVTQAPAKAASLGQGVSEAQVIPAFVHSAGLPAIDALSSRAHDNRAASSSTSENAKDEEDDFQFLNEDGLNFNWNEPNEDPTYLVSSKETQPHIGVVGNLRAEISYDKKIYDHIRSQLQAPPDFNNRNEYVVGNDGLSRVALGTHALMRARIKLMLEQHETVAWWKDGVVKSPDANFYCVEHFIALAIVMYDVTDWSLVSADDGDDFTPCKFDDEDDILHIGQLMADLLERANRSLSRDAYSKLGRGGLERGRAINKIIGIVVGSSRVMISGME